MSIIENYLQQGYSMSQDVGLASRLGLRLGRWLASRHGDVQIDRSARVSPAARVQARNGRLVIGPRCAVAGGAVLQGQIKMGADCSIQCYAVLVGYGEDGEIRLGTGVRIAPHVTMIAGDHIFKDNDRPIREQGLRRKPITIEDDVWIAGRVTIVAGVTIGRGSVIGAGAVVTGDIAPGSIAVGIPAKVIRVRDGFTES